MSQQLVSLTSLLLTVTDGDKSSVFNESCKWSDLSLNSFWRMGRAPTELRTSLIISASLCFKSKKYEDERLYFMLLHVFGIFLLRELRKLYFKPVGNMLFYDTGLCLYFVHAFAVAEHGTKRYWVCGFCFCCVVFFSFFFLEIKGFEKYFMYSFLKK